MFCTHVQIWPANGPESCPTLVTLLLATCSVKCPNGRRVSRTWPPCIERVRHCCHVPCLSVAPLLVQQALPHVVLASHPLRALFLSLLAPLRARAVSAMAGPAELPWPGRLRQPLARPASPSATRVPGQAAPSPLATDAPPLPAESAAGRPPCWALRPSVS